MRKRVTALVTAALFALTLTVPAQATDHGIDYEIKNCAGGVGASVRAYVRNTSSVDRVIQRHAVHFIADGPGAATDVTRPTLNLPVGPNARRQVATVYKEQGSGTYSGYGEWVMPDMPFWINVEISVSCVYPA